MTTPGPGPHAHDPRRAAEPPEATLARVERLLQVVQQLSGLLDDSMRCVTMARRVLSGALPDEPVDPGLLDDVGQHLRTASESLEKMAEVAHAALQGPGIPLGSPLLARARPITLSEAIQHAGDVLRPGASWSHCQIHVMIDPALADEPAGALYTVALNGIQNALESIARRPGPGLVLVTLDACPPPAGGGFGKDGRPWCRLRIEDDGVGPPRADASRVFDLGFTTKPRGAGVGLAVARNVVRSMGGTIALTPRDDGRAGAWLTACLPVPKASATLRIGGAA